MGRLSNYIGASASAPVRLWPENMIHGECAAKCGARMLESQVSEPYAILL